VLKWYWNVTTVVFSLLMWSGDVMNCGTEDTSKWDAKGQYSLLSLQMSTFCGRNRCMVVTLRSGNGSTPFWSSQKTGCRDRGKTGKTCFVRILCFEVEFNFGFVYWNSNSGILCCRYGIKNGIRLLKYCAVTISRRFFDILSCLHSLAHGSDLLCSAVFVWVLL